ncbi:piggyBac transposable element-derived protein 4-like [Anguilla anguilla]|uniref:piggyBac transposable element-derived protein 4-like n=1 Tax=Anguilla anguilla TaxID=7936 RepID=UPI0015A92913|nr:piggyBac transposable element-derived protein 4-like [Anguilla anguilla]
MPLKSFHTLSRMIRFDSREFRRAGRVPDKLAPIRNVWEKWAERLPCLYNPGPEVTVGEQLGPFRGCCPFRQYIPSKPGKYGIKIRTLCDATSSYVWNMQVNTRKAASGALEKNGGVRILLDMTEGLRWRNITCDSSFTSYELGQELLKRKMTMVGEVRKNRKGREVFSSKFAFIPSATLVSYCPKRNRSAVLLSTLHKDAEVGDGEDRKPAVVMDYNRSKGGVVNLGKATGIYSCKRVTARWPLVIFYNIIDVSSHNAVIIWNKLNPTWMAGKRSKKRAFLDQLGRELVTPQIQRRGHPHPARRLRRPSREPSRGWNLAPIRPRFRLQPL